MKYGEAIKAHRDDVERVAAHGFYSNQHHADRFFAQKIEPAWTHAIREEEDADLVDRFGITPTAKRVLFLFGRGVLRVGVTRKTPLIEVWPPQRDVDERGNFLRFRGLSKASIARLVRGSAKAVETALRSFKSQDTGGLFERRLLNVLSTEVGITLDGVFDPQLSLSFMFDVPTYDHADNFAVDSKVGNSAWVHRQRCWSREARETKLAELGVLVVPSRSERMPSTDSIRRAGSGGLP